VARDFAWLASNGGAWSLAANWDDLTDGISPSLVVPGIQDSVVVNGPGGSLVETLTGQGAVANALFAGNNVLSGSIASAAVTVGAVGAGGLLEVAAAGVLTAAAMNVASGSALASGAGARLDVSGQMVLGAGQSGLGAAAANLYATNGGMAQLGGLLMNASSAALYADPTSSIEVGLTGGAVAGVLTVDAGAVLAGQGNANGYGAVVNNGTIQAIGGALLLGALSGSGALQIEAGADLILNGATGAGRAVLFAGAQGTLAVATEFDAPQGTITGFSPGDAIDMLGSPISAATWAQSNSAQGVLTLWYGGQVADSLILAGNYTSSVFLTAGDGALGTLITVAPRTGGGGGPSPGTNGPDQYQWVAPGSGNWNSNANWRDVTSGAQPSNIPPGQHNLVEIDAGQSGSFAVIAGTANAAALTLTGDVALAGTYAVGTLNVGLGGANATVSVLDLLPATTLTANTAAIADGQLTVSGGAVLAVTGTLVLGGGGSGVGLPVTALSATAGGTVTAACLQMGGGSGNSLLTDPTGVIEIGTQGGAVAGAVTVDAGAVLSGNGEVNPFGAVVDNGTIAAAGGVLWLGSVTGGGVLDIGANAELLLQSSSNTAISFTSSNGVLGLASEFVVLGGTITGFVPGEAIDYANEPITGIAVSKGSGNAVLSLYYGSALVSRLTLAGSFYQ
jgi:hypothetical protein